MQKRASELIDLLRLEPHPEGGFYRQVHRSELEVQTGLGARRGVTTIYFLLPSGHHSKFHRVAGGDEIWHHLEGGELELIHGSLDAPMNRMTLGPISERAMPVGIIPAGQWQAARPLGEYALMGCTVGPGFEFRDFSMLADLPSEAARLMKRHPELASLV